MITVEAQTKLNEYFNLPAKGDEQDWDIELANKNRIEEFVVALEETWSVNERYAIAALILASYDDLISELSDPDDRIWKKVVTALDKNREEYIDLLNYWALWHEHDSNDVFSITPLVRAYLK